VTCHSLLCV